MSKARKKSANVSRASNYFYKTPKRLKAYGGRSNQTIAVDDEYRKAAAMLFGDSVVLPFVVGVSGPSGSPVMFGNAATGLLLTCAHVLGSASHGKYIANSDTTRSRMQDRLFTSKSWGEPGDRTQYPDTGDFDESLSFFSDKFDAEAAAFAAHFLLSSSAAYVRERFAKQEWALAGTQVFSNKESDTSWVHDPNGILDRLENKEAYPDDYEAAVLFAEVKPFRGEQKGRLLDALGKYIHESRFVEDRDSLVTLCSAIRKYAMNMPESRFEGYANWLLPTETATLHHEAEMEFSKGICWRLEFEPHAWPAEYPLLTKTLCDLVDSYLTPRLILQKSYANTAMFGMVALHVLGAISTSNKALVGNLRKKMVDSGVKWFVEMVDDKVDESIQYISERDEALAKEVNKIRQG